MLLNLLLAMLLKGRQNETENRVLLSATEATDPMQAIADARAELRDLEYAVGVVLLLLSSLPIPIALAFLAYDMRKEALLGYNPHDLWRPEASLDAFMPEKARRASHARVSLREKADAEATRKASVVEAPPNADATLEDAYPAVSWTDDDSMEVANGGDVTRITVDPAPAHESSTPREMPPPMAKSRMSSDHSMHSMRI